MSPSTEEQVFSTLWQTKHMNLNVSMVKKK
ncbi:hypothetical protein E2C01_021860 [Portunus trituberculatus]|uniref:Uncharacterized protein n=1 Tax=Portunus trituberculatus TaxID=210409 RepID=A0A5B7E3W4_PORTR|nr:hypothetical protein [Portunus trituberculatus]